MSVTMNLKKQVDTPVWEWTRFAPAATTAISSMACGDLPKDSRYMYYIVSAAFYRYDTWTDSWCQLASPNTKPLVFTAMRYSSFGGFRGRILGVSGTTLIIPALSGDILSGETIRIYAGSGANQTKTIVDVSEPIVYDQGLATATTNANQIQDTTKKWKVNQWAGYQVRLIYGLGVTQIRKVIYNDTQTLYFYDANYQQRDTWNNTGFSAVAPYAIPASTAGSQTTYLIEASIVTVDSVWSVAPNTTSRFTTHSGGVWLISQTASGAYHSLQYYDIASDTWYNRTTIAGILGAAPGTDIAMERISNRGGSYCVSVATTGTTRALIDTNLTGVTSGNTTIDRFVNYQVRIMGGTGLGQRRRIVANDLTTLYVNRKWDIVPDNTSQYEIWDEVFSMYVGGMASASLYNYHAEADMLCQGSVSDYGIVRNIGVRLDGWEDFNVVTAVRNVNGISGITFVPVVGGSGHAVGDIVTLGTGTNGKVYIEEILPGGAATLVSLYAMGTGYNVATATQSATSGAGTGLQIAITARTTCGRITTTGINHNIKIGDVVTFSGAVDSAWNTTYTVFGVDSLTTLDVEITAAANAVIANTTTVSLIVDCAANWDNGEHVGKLVQIGLSGATATTPTAQIRRITANTQTTLTLQSAVSFLPVQARYVIYDPSMIGRDEQYKYNKAQKGNTGWATTGTTTTLVDSTKNWNANQWAAYKLRIISGTGYDKNEITIISNSGSTLNFAVQTFSPDATTKYIIMDSFGLCTSLGSGTVLNDTTKAWKVNQWAGKRVRITSGTGVMSETTITSNTATQLTAASGMGSPTTDSTYTIMGVPARGAGIALLHIYNTKRLNIKGRYLFFPRGGASNTIDKLDIPTEVYEYGNFFSPQSETLTTGSMYSYDGDDKIYFTKDATGRIYVYDINTNKISNASTIPYGQGSALIGNRMEIIETSDGLKYIYMMRHSGTEMFRNLLWW